MHLEKNRGSFFAVFKKKSERQPPVTSKLTNFVGNLPDRQFSYILWRIAGESCQSLFIIFTTVFGSQIIGKTAFLYGTTPCKSDSAYCVLVFFILKFYDKMSVKSLNKVFVFIAHWGLQCLTMVLIL